MHCYSQKTSLNQGGALDLSFYVKQSNTAVPKKLDISNEHDGSFIGVSLIKISRNWIDYD